MAKHRWHDEIVAWAAGAKIQRFGCITRSWYDDDKPNWNDPSARFRIKPERKPDIDVICHVQMLSGSRGIGGSNFNRDFCPFYIRY